VPVWMLGVLGGIAVAGAVKWTTVRAGGRYLHWRANARRSDIETTLPGAVRYLRVLASGNSDPRGMLGRVADQRAYGETATAFRRALNEARLAGSLDAGLELVARDTPSRDLLAPFLLKYREHADQGADALAEYLRMEGRLLSHRQSRTRDRVEGYLELLAEMFVVLLVLPALAVLILTVLSVLAGGLSKTASTPLGVVTTRQILIYSSTAFVLAVGTQYPDLVDKPVGGYLGLVPWGRVFMHSLPFAVPVSGVALAYFVGTGRPGLGFGFVFGYFTHLLSDWRNQLRGGEVPADLFWPLVPLGARPETPGWAGDGRINLKIYTAVAAFVVVITKF